MFMVIICLDDSRVYGSRNVTNSTGGPMNAEFTVAYLIKCINAVKWCYLLVVYGKR